MQAKVCNLRRNEQRPRHLDGMSVGNMSPPLMEDVAVKDDKAFLTSSVSKSIQTDFWRLCLWCVYCGPRR